MNQTTAAHNLPEFSDRGRGYRSSLTGPSASILHMALAKAAPSTAFVLEYLARGNGLTDEIAISVLGVQHLASEITKLRNFGVPIVGEWHQDKYHNYFLVYRHAPGECSHDEPLYLGAGTEHWENEGGPPHPEA